MAKEKFDTADIIRRVLKRIAIYITIAKNLYFVDTRHPENGAVLMAPAAMNALFVEVFGKPLSKPQLEILALKLIEKARKRAFTQEVYTRVGFDEGAVYFDLGKHGVVKITKKVAKVIEIEECPVPFCRPKEMGDLPAPDLSQSSGAAEILNMLKELLNLEKADIKLALAWLVAPFCPTGTRPILLLEGPQGSAKSIRNGCRSLNHVPEKSKTEEICLAAVRNYGLAILKVPNGLKTPEVCLAAVHNNGWMLQFVPNALRTPELCLVAVRNDGEALQFVPKEMRTPELCMDAVQNYGPALKYVPTAYRTEELCQTAKQNITVEEQDYADAQYAIGWMYEHGCGVIQNLQTAIMWYKKAARQGDALAQTNLGILYAGGRSTRQNNSKAVKCFQQAADQGHAPAQCRLGLMYKYGRGVPQSIGTAAEWIQKAADKGYAPAQCYLGEMYEWGTGVPQSDIDAATWIRRSAEQGYAPAQFELGWLYANGRGVNLDYDKALEWYQKSADQVNPDATAALVTMKRLAKVFGDGEREVPTFIRATSSFGELVLDKSTGTRQNDGKNTKK
ncbi:MAG: hypothetical protein DELT_00304 [Desulfovibrio sp.]